MSAAQHEQMALARPRCRRERTCRPPSSEHSVESLLAQVLPRARLSARLLAREDADADDLVQEAMLRAYSRFSTFEPGTNFGAWFSRILTNVFYMKCRRERRYRSVALEDVSPGELFSEPGTAFHSTAPLPSESYVTRIETRKVGRAIADLPHPYRPAAELYFLGELTYPEVAARLGCPIGTVRSRLHRARRMLQEVLRTLGQDHGLVPPDGAGGNPSRPNSITGSDEASSGQESGNGERVGR